MKRFLGTAVALTAIFGVYVVAREAHLEVPFFIILGLSAAVAFGRQALETLGNLLNAVRYYGRNLHRIQDLEDARQRDAARIQAIMRELEEARSAGIEEGKMQVLGTMFSRHLKRMPVLKGVVLGTTGPVFIAECREDSLPFLWTRFVLEDSLTGLTKGILEVREVDRKDGRAILGPQDFSDAQFWKELVSRAAVDSTIPQNLRLKRYVFELPQVFEEPPPLLEEEPSHGE